MMAAGVLPILTGRERGKCKSASPAFRIASFLCPVGLDQQRGRNSFHIR